MRDKGIHADRWVMVASLLICTWLERLVWVAVLRSAVFILVLVIFAAWRLFSYALVSLLCY